MIKLLTSLFVFMTVSITVNAETNVDEFTGHDYEVHSVSYSKSGRFLASGSGDTNVIVWDTYHKSEFFKISDHNRTVYSVAFSKLDENLLATSSSDGHLILWDINTQKIVKTLVKGDTTSNGILSIDFSPTHHLLAVSYMGGELALWDTKNFKLVNSVPAHEYGFAMSVKFSPEGKRIMTTGGVDNSIRLFNMHDLSLRQIFYDQHSNSTVWDAAFSPTNYDEIAAVNSLGFLEIWREGKKTVHKRTEINDYLALSVEYSKDGTKIYAGVDAFNSEVGNFVKIIDANSLEILNQFDLHKNRVRGMALSPDGKFLATASWDQTVKVLTLD